MSLFEYRQSLGIAKDDPTFAALIMAAMRKADDFNSFQLKSAFPEIYQELRERYDAPGGKLKYDEQ